jgi:SAM-dependent methyltransferase
MRAIGGAPPNDSPPDAASTEDSLLPPNHLIFVGGDKTNFKQIGDKWVQTFIRLGGLRPTDRVLDVGSGVGRMALALTGYLTAPGSFYDGFDIVREGVDWCRREITARFPNFRFQHSDLFNSCYNLGGQLQPTDFRFPYPDAAFDFVFLTSVFTHMLPRDLEHYLAEIVRVLRPDARCLISYFLLSDELLRRVEREDKALGHNFRYDMGEYRTTNEATPESAVAYHERSIREKYARAGLKIVEPIHYGGWSGSPGALHGQDIIVACSKGL